MAASALSLRSLFTYLSANSKDRQGFLKGNSPLIYGCKPTVMNKENFSLSSHNFELNCMRDKEMDVSTSALVDGIAECSNEKETVEIREPGELSVSTLLMHFANEFDPYDALSTPLYQTATFKQRVY